MLLCKGIELWVDPAAMDVFQQLLEIGDFTQLS